MRLVLDEVFPEQQVDTIEQTADSGHLGNQTVRIHFEDDTVAYLKIRTDGDAERNAREAASTQYARNHCEVRVPTVLAVDSLFDPPYLAMAPIEGVSARDQWTAAALDNRKLIAHEIGRAIAGVSQAHFTEPGWIVGGDQTDLDLETGRWSAVLADALERRAEEIPYSDRFSDVPERVATLIREKHAILDRAPAALIHAVVRTTNLFLNGIPGLIDWEWTLVGDPGLMLCWAEGRIIEQADVPDNHRETLREAVRDGYRKVAGELPAGFERRLPLYRVITFLPKLQTFHLWAPDAPEPVNELATWVEDELETRIMAANAVE